ncbi:MAG: lactate racemase domain-containing protein [Atribacterota bacterium]
MMILEMGTKEDVWTDSQFADSILQAINACPVDRKRILVIIPDNTRTAPMKLLFSSFRKALKGRVTRLDFMIALGTHHSLTPEQIQQEVGITPEEALQDGNAIFNHSWDDPAALRLVGVLSASEMKTLSQGLLSQDVPVLLNKKIFEYDELFLLGPVFPHEVVGFSGGFKYLFPGVSGPEIIHAFHWLSALITNPKIIGHKNTPVREVLNHAAHFVPLPITAFCFVMKGEKPCGLFVGDPQEAWSKAADLSARVNIIYREKPAHTVLSIAPSMYTELWVGGKCMYKLEPVVEDGGKLIIYAPHLHDISITHGRYLMKIGYHTRDFLLTHWDQYKQYPSGVLAHSTQVKGIGLYREGKEVPRIEVVLATGIPEDICRKINLGYLDYRTLDPRSYMGRENEGILVVPRAGEMLYRLSNGKVPDVDRLNARESSSFGIV